MRRGHSKRLTQLTPQVAASSSRRPRIHGAAINQETQALRADRPMDAVKLGLVRSFNGDVFSESIRPICGFQIATLLSLKIKEHFST